MILPERLLGDDDHRLEAKVCDIVQDRLRSSAHAHLSRDVSWHFHGGRLTLRGRVPSYYLKQVVQERVKDIMHVRQIRNEVEVASWPERVP